MSSVLKMHVSVFLIESILPEFQLNLQKKIVCRKLLCSQAGNYSWRELFSWPYFRPTSLKIFKFLISEQLWNPIDFIVTHKEDSVEFFIWHHWEKQANRINIFWRGTPHRWLYSKLGDYDNDSPAVFAWDGCNGSNCYNPKLSAICECLEIRGYFLFGLCNCFFLKYNLRVPATPALVLYWLKFLCFSPSSEPASWLILALCTGFMISFDSHALTLPPKTPLYSLARAAQWEVWSASGCWNCCWLCNLSPKCTSCLSCPLQGHPLPGEKKDFCLSSGKEKIVRK